MKVEMSVYSAQTNITASEPYFILNSGTAASPAVNVPALTGISSINGYAYASGGTAPPYLSGVSTMGGSVSTMIITVPYPVGAPKGFGVVLTPSGGTPGTSVPTFATNGTSSFFVNATAGTSFTWLMIGNTQ